jgi:hypothetical protein
MRTMTVVVPLEFEELHLEVSSRPEQSPIQTLAANSADQPFNERMREWHVRHGFDVRHVKDSQIGLPSVEPIQRIMV